MTTGRCERCGNDNDGGRICIRCDHYETILGRLQRLIEVSGVITSVRLAEAYDLVQGQAAYEGRAP